MKKYKLKKTFATLFLAGSLGMSAACGKETSTSTSTPTIFNRQVIDLNKSFNVAIEPNDDTISVAPIANYKDYEGSQVEIILSDGLIVLSSTHQLELVRVYNKESLEAYVDALTDNDDTVKYYDTNIIYDDSFNKKFIDLNYSFDKAIILKDGSATILDITSWKDYRDDKIQIKLADGTCILTEVDNIKLINDTKAQEDSIERYAESLVGSSENVKRYIKK